VADGERVCGKIKSIGGAVAQLGARLDGIEEVVGSNPIGSTNILSKRVSGSFCYPLPNPHFSPETEYLAGGGFSSMARHGRVSVYRRDNDGKYHFCDPRGNYSRDTTFVLRYEAEKGHRVWETLPAGTDHTTARRKALERELALTGTPSLSKAQAKPKPLPGFTRIRDAADKYIDALWAEGNLVPRTIKDKRFELNRWMGWATKQHIEELERADLIAFRDRLHSEGLAEWTVKTNMTTVVTMLKHNPLKQITGLLKPEDWPDIEDTEPEPYDVEEVKALQSVATEDEKLLIRFFVGTGMREQEVAHTEWEDFNWAAKTVWVHAKPRLDNWKPKTRAGTRKIPLTLNFLSCVVPISWSKRDTERVSMIQRKSFSQTVFFLRLATVLLTVSVQTATRAQNPVIVQVNAGQKIAPFEPIYAFFGYDEANYTYTKNGSKLVGELVARPSTQPSVPEAVRTLA